MRQKLIFIGLILGIQLFGCVEKQESRPPNIVLIFSDEMDPSYVSSYGGNIPTPAIDKLASQGIRFEHAYVTAPMCTPSRFSLLSGLYPGRCNHPQFLEANPREQPYVIAWNTYLTEELATIPKVLSANGYFTGMVGKWHIGRLPENIILPVLDKEEDLDDPETDRKLKELQEIHRDQVKKEGGFDYAKSVLWGNFDGFVIEKLRFHNFPWITKGALDFLEAASKKDQPFFLYCATTAVHGPSHIESFKTDVRYTLEGKMEGLGQFQLDPDSILQVIETVPAKLRHKYSGMASVDHHVSLIMEKLRELNLEKNTMVIFMADHNVEPGKTTCYEKGLKVPLIIKWPGSIKPNSVNQVMVQSIDLFPTILQLAAIETQSLALDGKSIVKVLLGEETPVHDYIYAESGLTRSVSDGRFKYISFRYPRPVIVSMQRGELRFAPNYMNMERQAHSSIAMEHFPSYFDADQLFDLENDPYEQKNLAYDPAYSDQLKKMQEVLVGYLERLDYAYHFSYTAFMRSPVYRKMTENSRAIGTDYIPWLQRDHGRIIWPPE